MNKLKKPFLCIIPVLLLCSCAAPVSAPLAVTQPAASSAFAAPSVSLSPSPSPSSTDADVAEPSPSAEDITVSPDKDGCAFIPGSVPEITAADLKKFKSDKVFGYLALDGCITDKDYWYTLDSAQLKDGKLYLTLSLSITFVDINVPYQDLKKKYQLSDKDILKMPLFEDCVIKGGILYADEDVWEDRQQYDSYKAWQDDNNGYANCPEDGCTLDLSASVPVSDNPDIILFDFNNSDTGGYSHVTMQDFKNFVLNPDNINDYGDGKYLLDNLYFKFSGGEITTIYENEGDI